MATQKANMYNMERQHNVTSFTPPHIVHTTTPPAPPAVHTTCHPQPFLLMSSSRSRSPRQHVVARAGPSCLSEYDKAVARAAFQLWRLGVARAALPRRLREERLETRPRPAWLDECCEFSERRRMSSEDYGALRLSWPERRIQFLWDQGRIFHL